MQLFVPPRAFLRVWSLDIVTSGCRSIQVCPAITSSANKSDNDRDGDGASVAMQYDVEICMWLTSFLGADEFCFHGRIYVHPELRAPPLENLSI
jgi:hypothetical protein